MLQKRFLTWLLLFFGVFLVLQTFNSPKPSEDVVVTPLSVQTVKSSYSPNEPVSVTVLNSTGQPIVVADDCPANPFYVYRYVNGKWVPTEATSELVHCNVEPYLFPPQANTVVDFSPWSQSLFSTIGKYKIEVVYSLSVDEESIEPLVSYTEFEVKERGLFKSLMFTGLYRPISNFLLFLVWILPGHNFGWALLTLTILIRLILLVPNQKALMSQRSMQKIQPELEAIKKKYAGDQQKIASETMALWKRHKVSPLNSCLPVLVQFPILIALFYVIRDGITPYQSYLLYDFLHVDLSLIDMNFLGVLDLSVVNVTWLPVLVGLLQFTQMKLSFAKAKKKSGEKELLDIEEKANGDVVIHDSSKKEAPDPMKTMQTMMVYVMPVMIAVMTASFPSGVGIYWGVSTLFGIGQQIVVNRK